MKYLILLSLFTISISCKKEPLQYKIIGSIINVNTTNTVANAKLKFYQTVVNGNALNPNFIYIGSTITNSTGEYSFRFDREKSDEFKIEVEHEEFYNQTEMYSFSLLSTQNENNFSFKLESKSWIKVRLLNTFVETNEILNFYKHNLKEDCITCCANGNVAIPYTIPDTTFICPVVGDKYFKYTYGEVLANSSTTDSVLCQQNDTTEVFIQY